MIDVLHLPERVTSRSSRSICYHQAGPASAKRFAATLANTRHFMAGIRVIKHVTIGEVCSRHPFARS